MVSKELANTESSWLTFRLRDCKMCNSLLTIVLMLIVCSFKSCILFRIIKNKTVCSKLKSLTCFFFLPQWKRSLLFDSDITFGMYCCQNIKLKG